MAFRLSLNARIWFFALFAYCVALLVFALYLEHARQLEPCPMCALQRLAYLVVAVVALPAAIHKPGHLGLRLYSVPVIVALLAGLAVAVQHVRLQHLPADQVPACGPGLDYMLEVFPLREALQMILSGSGECAEVQWRFLGLSIPEWSVVNFLLLLIVATVGMFYARRITG